MNPGSLVAGIETFQMPGCLRSQMRKLVYIVCSFCVYPAMQLHAQDQPGQVASSNITGAEELYIDTPLDSDLQRRVDDVRDQRAVLRQKSAEQLANARDKSPEEILQIREAFVAENSDMIEALREAQQQLVVDLKAASNRPGREIMTRESPEQLEYNDRDVALEELRDEMNRELVSRIEALEEVTPEALKQVREEVLAIYAGQLASLRRVGSNLEARAAKGPPPGKNPHGMPPGLAKKQQEMRELRNLAEEEARQLGQILQEIMTDQSLSKEEKRERAQEAKRIWREEQRQRREQVKELRRQLRELDERE